MVRSAVILAMLVGSGGIAIAQQSAPRPSMPPPPSFTDPVSAPSKTTKGRVKKPAARTPSAAAADPTASFERPNKFVPAEFDGPRSRSGGGAAPMMTGNGRPGMGMRF